MLLQTSLAEEKISLPLQVETVPPALSQDVASQKSTRLLWTGLGFAVLMLVGVSACAFHPRAQHAFAEPSRLGPELAFSPTSALRRGQKLARSGLPTMSDTPSTPNAVIRWSRLPGKDPDSVLPYFNPQTLNLLGQLYIGNKFLTEGQLADQHLGDPQQWLVGAVAAIPILAISRGIEYSDLPAFADINMNTKGTMLKMFGSKSQPVFALAASIGLALSTAVIEETIFRGFILYSISQWSVDNHLAENLPEALQIGLVASSLAFAIGHGDFKRPFSKDNAVLVGLQMLTGLSFGSTYLLTQSLAAPIIQHFLYDLYTFYETHLVITDQVAYAESGQRPPIGPSEEEVRELKGDELVDDAIRAFLLMDTNRDGAISAGEFRMGFRSMGFKIKEREFQSAFKDADIDENGEIDFDEFLQFLLNPNGTYEAEEFLDRLQELGMRP